MTLEEKIKKIISEKLGVTLKEIDPNANLADDLGADPIEIADLLVSLEEGLKINFTDEEKEEVKTVEQIINLAAQQAPDS